MRIQSFSVVILTKLGQLVFAVFFTSLLIFFIVQLTPGDIAEIHSLSPATVEKLNLDKSVITQYLLWFRNCLWFDFGISFTYGTPVREMLVQYAGTTLTLTFGSLFLSLLISIPIAIYLGNNINTEKGKILSSIVYGVSVIPVFVLGYIALGIVFGIFHFYPLDLPEGDVGFWPWMAYYILPIVVLSIGNGTIGEFVRLLSLEVRDVSLSLYIKAARSRGTSLFKHFFRPVIIPFLSIIISRFAVLIGGVIVVERIFNRHGLGWLTWEATLNRDFYVIMSVTLLTALLIRTMMFLNDIAAYALDPRLRKN